MTEQAVANGAVVAPGRRFGRAPLAVKLAFAFLGLVAFVLIVNGAIDTWLTYNQAKRAALEVEEEKARSAAERVDAFLNEIQTELGWTAGVEWGYAKLEQQRYDFIRLLRQAPAITALSYIDGHGKEQIAVSRLEPDSIGGGKDFSDDPRFVRAVADKIWFGPVEFRRGSEPYMTIALAHVGKTPGVTVADVNLKLVWDVVSAIHVGDKGFAYVVDDHGRLIAHPDLSLVLRDNDLSHLPQVAAALAAQRSNQTSASPVGSAEAATSLDGASVLTAYAIAPKTHWVVFVEQPLAEALATAYRSLARALALLGLGLALAAVSGVALARRMAAPIRLLRQGAEKLGAGDLSQRLDIRTGDEIEALAGSFNRMAGSLQESYETLEAKVEARTRDLEESLERQTATSKILEVIAGSPADAGPVFEAIAASANAVMRGYSTTVFRIIEDRAHLMAFTPTSPEADAALRASFPVPLAEFSPFVFVNGGQSYQVADTEANDDPRIHDIGRARGFRSMIFTPLVHQGRSIGVIAVTRRTAGVFAPADVAQLRAFADQAVIAIQNARLFEEVQAKTRDLEESLAQQTATADVLKVISRSAFDLDTIFQTLVTSAVDLCKASSGTVCVRDGDVFRYRGMAGPEASADVRRFLVERPLVSPTRNTTAGRAILSGQAEEIRDVLLEEDYAVPFASLASPARSLLGVPLLGKAEVLGAIVVARAEPGAFPPRHVEILRTFADQAVIAIENARLFAQVQARTRALEDALAKQTATAEILRVISGSPTDANPVFASIVAAAARLLPCDLAFIMLVEGKTWWNVAAATAEGLGTVTLTDRYPVDPDLNFPSRAIVGKTTTYLPDWSEIELPEHQVRVRALNGINASIHLPFLREGECVGLLTLLSQSAHPFGAAEIAQAESFRDQALIAIENSRLFNETQEALKRQTATASELEKSLADLRKTQDRLVQSEKLASLGQLTAGIAHEIKNPLNFVNNFASLSRELLEEMKQALAPAPLEIKAREDVDELMGMLDSNLEKVAHHGKRADSIVKNMLLHSREGSGERARVDVNAMVEEAVGLGYHGARAEKPGFNVTVEKRLDPEAGDADLYLQEMTRVLLNLVSNGFYATAKRKHEEGADYQPMLIASTRSLGARVEIRVRDNGGGIPPEVRAKMFNPFFTTKPAGEGTGLGLSLSHDIVVKQHGGTIDVETEPGSFTEFVITLPRDGAKG